MSDLIESRISEIRERLAAATPGPWTYEVSVRKFEDSAHYSIQTVDNQPGHPWSRRFIAWMCGGRQITAERFAELNATQQQRLIDDGFRGDKRIEPDAALIANAPSDLEALLAERDGMKAEIERLRDDVSEKHPQLSDTLHRQMPCGEVDAANRANGTASVGLPHSAEVAASHSCPICGRIAPEHDVGCPVDLYVRRLSAPLDPSSAPSETLSVSDLYHAAAAAERKAWASRGSPDREAGSGTDDAGTCIVDGGSETLHCLTHGVSFERGGGDRIPETCRETTWRPPRASSHPVPSEGGGE